jgi:hypothetical protein
MEFGDFSVSAISVSKNILPRELKRLKQQFNTRLFTFENALIRLPPFRRTNCFETTIFLFNSLKGFYAGWVFIFDELISELFSRDSVSTSVCSAGIDV